MTALPHIQYFLGANSPTGFYSLYDHLLSPKEARAIYILKGGPGCGKSTLMRKIGAWAQESGLEAEYILCSGDPDSLDALILPSKKVAIVDGTAPQGVVTEGHLRGRPGDARWENLNNFGWIISAPTCGAPSRRALHMRMCAGGHRPPLHQNRQKTLTSCRPVAWSFSPISIRSTNPATNSRGTVSSFKSSSARSISSA